MLEFHTFVIELKAKIMKGLLLLIGISFSISAYSQNNTVKTDWDKVIITFCASVIQSAPAKNYSKI
tara:strand:+ start:726 stop:923 length:198 start_codon:yes stop_codon:yes gene_type:complete